MNRVPPQIVEEMAKSLHEISALRDEVRTQLHLVNLDLKDQWTKLLPHLTDSDFDDESHFEEIEATRVQLFEVVARLAELLGGLSGRGGTLAIENQSSTLREEEAARRAHLRLM